MIYLDNAASTIVLPEVKAKLIECLDIYGNPSSLHEEGFKAKQLINEAKITIAQKLNCSISELFFTSGATMSNNTILRGFNGKIAVSAIEHEDIQMLAERFEYSFIKVNELGELDLDCLEKFLISSKKKKLISLKMIQKKNQIRNQVKTN